MRSVRTFFGSMSESSDKIFKLFDSFGGRKIRVSTVILFSSLAVGTWLISITTNLPLRTRIASLVSYRHHVETEMKIPKIWNVGQVEQIEMNPQWSATWR
jgi:hypothetical protein